MQSEHMLGTRIKPTPYQKSFEILTDTGSRVVDFTGENKQFSFFTISVVYDKSDQHISIYDSHNTELGSIKIKSVILKNASNTYSTFNSVKLDTKNPHNKFLIYNQFAAWYCKGCSIARLSDYANNPVSRITY